MIVIYDPPTSAGVPISRVQNWNDPKVLSDGLVAALRQSSHGQMRFAIVGQPIVITNNLPAWDNDGTVDTADKPSVSTIASVESNFIIRISCLNKRTSGEYAAKD